MVIRTAPGGWAVPRTLRLILKGWRPCLPSSSTWTPGGSAATRLTRSWALRTGSLPSAGHQVAGPHAGRERRAVHQNIHHRDAAARDDAELRRLLIRQILRHESQPAADHVAMLQDLLHDAAHEIDGNRKTDPFGSAGGAVQHGGVDADQVALRVDERAAGIAEIDGGIGLNEILESRESELTAARGAHDALRHGLADAVGIADREHDVADAQCIGAAHGHDGQLGDVQMQNGDVRVGILPDDGRVGDATVGELHPDRIRARDDVLIRHDGAGGIDDDAGSQAAFDALAIARPKIAEQLIEHGCLGALRDDACGIDVHHGGRRARHRIGEAAA